MKTVLSPFPAFLLRHWLAISTVLLVLSGCAYIYLMWSVQQVSEAAETHPALLSPKQVTVLQEKLAVETSKREVAEVVAVRAAHAADSAIHQARRHDVRADSLLKAPLSKTADENFGTLDATAAPRLQRFLTDYAPKGYALDGDTLQ